MCVGDMLLVERQPDGQWPDAESWMKGRNERTGREGEFPGNWTLFMGEFAEESSPQRPPRIPERPPRRSIQAPVTPPHSPVSQPQQDSRNIGGRRFNPPAIPTSPPNNYGVSPANQTYPGNTGPAIPPIPPRKTRGSIVSNDYTDIGVRVLPRQEARSVSDDMYVPVGQVNVPPTPVATIKSGIKAPPLEEAEWYWADVGRDEVNRVLQDAEDGSFLIRDKTGYPGDYTLTLKKDGVIRMIRIFNHQGMYGFSEPFNFVSVFDLVQYYRIHSLRDYNSQLDIRLLYAASKYDDTNDKTMKIEEIVEELRKAEEEYDDRNNEFQKKSDVFTSQMAQEAKMNNRRKAHAFIITLWQDQLSKLTGNTSQVIKSDGDVLESQFRSIRSRLQTAESELKNHDKIAAELEEQTVRLDKEMQEMKPRILELEQTKAQFMSQLGRLGLKPDEIKRRLFALKKANRDIQKEENMKKRRRASYIPNEEDDEESFGREDVYFDIYGTTQDLIRDDEDDKDWKISVSRSDSEKLLAPCEDGVFLVRARSGIGLRETHRDTLCIAFRGEVNHIKILCEEGFYGFTSGCCQFQSLADLVRHYQTTSLHQHNAKLTISLTTPYNKWNRLRRH